MTLLIRRLVTGCMASGATALPGSTAFPGCRYALAIQNPFDSSFNTRTDLIHFAQESPAQPGTTARKGKPCFTGSVSPFIEYARRVSG